MNLISLEFSNQHNPFNHNIYTSRMVDLHEFDLIFDSTKFDNKLDNVIRMYHFLFSHFDIQIDENCNEVKELKIELYLQEEILLKCVSKKIIKFLNVLKKEGIYNNSLIVLKSDHGKPPGYYKKYPYSLNINNSKYFGYGRYKPFILIKDKNSCDSKFFGNNISLDEKTFKKNKYEIYLPNKKYTFLKIEDFTKYEIFNDISLLDSLKLNDIILK